MVTPKRYDIFYALALSLALYLSSIPLPSPLSLFISPLSSLPSPLSLYIYIQS